MASASLLKILVVLAIILVVFGPRRLPELGKAIGEGIRGFRGAMDGEHDDPDRDVLTARRDVEEAEASLAAAEAKAAGRAGREAPGSSSS
jgi:sec-independent protein translocase protein TatA